MSALDVIELAVLVIAITGLGWPLGLYMARVYRGDTTLASRVWGPVERVLYRVAGVDASKSMTWGEYARAILAFNALGFVWIYALQRLQHFLPGNPAGLGPVTSEVSFNTAISFATNTNWQAYGGETTMSHLTQMLALGSQNFLSAATGMAVLAALVRGIAARSSDGLGNAWVDLTRTTLHILLPLALVVALLLVAGGVIQTFDGTATVAGLHGAASDIALGPVASQEAIKQLGTNGGGYFNVNSAHPLENPTPFTNLVEVVAILLIPAALAFTFGEMVRDRRQGWALLATMWVIFLPLALITMNAELAGTPLLDSLALDTTPSLLQSGGNMEGKEVRFGIVDSSFWATATTAASNGSVNAMHDSFTPLGGLVPMWLMQLGEIVFGGVGSGLYGLLVYVVLTVFIAGLMVGRTPEYLGKKIEAFEMKMAALVVLLPSVAVLVGTAIACVVAEGTAVLGNPGTHGFSEILYAFSSGANNNGSAFGGLTASGPFYATAIGTAMAIGRYGVIVPVLAMAGSLARKRVVPASAGTLPTHTPLFVGLLVGTIVLVGALTFVPSLALGPVAEHLAQLGGRS